MSEMKRDSSANANQPVIMAGPATDSDEVELSLTDIFRTIFKHSIMIICTVLIIFAMVAIYTFVQTPVYESVARIVIDPSRSSNLGLEDLIGEKLGSGDTDSHVTTEVRIIQSETIAMHVISSLGLAKQKAFAGKMAAVSKVTDPEEMGPADRQHLVGIFQSSLKVQAIPHSQMVEIRFRSTDPKLAKAVVNALIDEYMQSSFQTRYDSAAQVANWLSKQIDDLKAKSTEAQLKLAEFQKQNNILGTDENDNIVIDRLKALNSQLTEAEADRIVKEARHRLADSGNPELIASTVPDPTLQTLRTQEADLKAQLAQLTSKYGAGYPKVHELQTQLGRLDADIASEIHNVGKRLDAEYQSAVKTESLLRDALNQQKENAYKLNESAVQYEVLKHEVETSQDLHDTLQLKLKESGITAGLSSGYISIVDRAQIPASPIAPKKTMNLVVGLLGGIFLSLVLVFIVDSLDDTVQTSEDVEAVLRFPTVGVIPLITKEDKSLDESGAAQPSTIQSSTGTISARHPKSQFAEAFRSLRSALLLSSIDQHPKVLLITSAGPAQGKSTISANLAAAFAQNGSKVLLVDADLRRPVLHSIFGVSQNPGLSSILSGVSPDTGPIAPIASLPNLFVLTSGPIPPMPAELLASSRFRELVASWKHEYDQVIIDSPPILAVTDALILGVAADGVLVVARSGVARKKALQRVGELLRRANANIRGIVLNGVNMRLENYYYSSYSSYGYKSGDEYSSY